MFFQIAKYEIYSNMYDAALFTSEKNVLRKTV